MAIVKLTKDKYQYKGDVIKVIHYIGNLSKCNHEIFGGRNLFNYFNYYGDLIAEQFLAIQQGQRFVRRIYHLIISFDSKIDNADLFFAQRVGQRLCDLYPEYQSIFVVHEDKEALHMHMVFNNCPIFPGKPKLTSVFNLPLLQDIVDTMISKHLGIPM